MPNSSIEIKMVPVGQLKPAPYNPRKWDDKAIKDLTESVKRFGLVDPIIVNSAPERQNIVIGGHFRLKIAKDLGHTEVPVVFINVPEEAKERELNIRLNKNLGDWDLKALADFDEDFLKDVGFGTREIAEIFGLWEKTEIKQALTDDFIIPPFSIWDARQQYWQDRKRLWKRYFGDSRDGRADDLLGAGMKSLSIAAGHAGSLTGTSEFDPVLAEIAYRWFAPKNATVLDPFAGGCVRGIVGATLGHEYHGIDLSATQMKTNQEQAAKLALTPTWYHNDSAKIDEIIPEKKKFDFLLTCPPYYDLEKYNDGPGDISMLGTYEDFIQSYAIIFAKAIKRLKENRFACVVVGDFRDASGYYRGFVNDTIKIFQENGMRVYNDIILANAIGTAAARARGYFSGGRKVVKVHQNILVFKAGEASNLAHRFEQLPRVERDHDQVIVFYHGDPKKIKSEMPKVETDTPLGFEDSFE